MDLVLKINFENSKYGYICKSKLYPLYYSLILCLKNFSLDVLTFTWQPIEDGQYLETFIDPRKMQLFVSRMKEMEGLESSSRSF